MRRRDRAAYDQGEAASALYQEDRGVLLTGVTTNTINLGLPHRVAPVDDTNWAARGSCVTADPDALFVRGRAQREAKAVCRDCPVLLDCLADALDNRTEFGVWGGMTERERRALLLRHPYVRSWRAEIRRQVSGQSGRRRAG